MNQTRLMIAVGIIAIYIASWYVMFNDSKNMENEYNQYIQEARRQTEMGVRAKAEENYNKALEMRDTLKLRVEIAEVMRDDFKDDSSYYWRCEEMIEKYPSEPEGYERIAKICEEEDDFVGFFDIYYEAQESGIASKYMDETYAKYENEFDIKWNYASEVKGYRQGMYCALSNKNYATQEDKANGIKEKYLWGYTGQDGKFALTAQYDMATTFNNSGLALVVKEGESAVIDIYGTKQYGDSKKRKLQDIGYLGDDIIVFKFADKWHYADLEFNKKFGDFDEAGSFSEGLAAVKEGDKWYIINTEGEKLWDKSFEDVKLDVDGMAFIAGRAFVKENGKYRMIDTSGNYIGDNGYDDVDTFITGEPAAVCIDDKWGYVDVDGKMVIEPKYDGARSFSNGYAAYNMFSQWGFIDAEEKTVIDSSKAGFQDAYYFNEAGFAFIGVGEEMIMIRFCRFEAQYN